MSATLRWVQGAQAEAPISQAIQHLPATRFLKTERLHAEDALARASISGMADCPEPEYCDGVRGAIDWLLGDSTESPLDMGNRRP